MTERTAPNFRSAKSILVGLAIHFLIWSVLSVWLWWPSSALYVLCAPVLSPFYFKGHFDFGWAIAGVTVSVALAALVVLSLVKRLRWVILLTHGAVLLYWLTGAVLLAFDVEW